jgi:hypothetical protein
VWNTVPFRARSDPARVLAQPVLEPGLDLARSHVEPLGLWQGQLTERE